MNNNKINAHDIKKIIMVGDHGVGKTSLMMRFLYDTFKEESLPKSVGIGFKTKNIYLDENNTSVKINLWDTGGNEKLMNMHKFFFKNVDAVLLIYDVRDTRPEINSFIML